MDLQEKLIKNHGKRLVKVIFEDGCSVVLPVAKALAPNASMRYFPTANPGSPTGYLTPAEMGWKQPYYYAEEISEIEVL